MQQQVAAAGTIASEEIERRGEKKEREKESTRKDRASCFTTTAPSVTDEHDDHLRFQLNDSSCSHVDAATRASRLSSLTLVLAYAR